MLPLARKSRHVCCSPPRLLVPSVALYPATCTCNPITCHSRFFHSVLAHSPVLRFVVIVLMPDVTASHIIDSPPPRLSHRGRCHVSPVASVSVTLSKRFYINRLLALLRLADARTIFTNPLTSQQLKQRYVSSRKAVPVF
jgi:hypothetical protein